MHGFKDYFGTFDYLVRNSCVWREFLTINIFLHTKAVPKLKGNFFYTSLIFKNSLKPFLNLNRLILIEKQALIRLSSVIGIK